MNYSLADHTISITSKNQSIGSSNYFSLIIGNGTTLESASVSFANDNVSFTMGADGTGATNINRMRNGSISINLIQTNPINKDMQTIYVKQSQQIAQVYPADIVIKDSYGNINAQFEECYITKYADYEAGNEASARSWAIIFKKGTEN